MSKALWKALLGTCVALAVAMPLRAAEDVKTPKSYAVLIGISEYGDKEITPRPHAEADAQALYDLLTNKDYLGADHVRLLLGKEDAKRHSQKATRENILKALSWVATEAKRDDLVILAWIGQGAPLGEQGDRVCYFTTDSNYKDRLKTAITAAEISHELDKVKSQRFCGFVDVSFKGPGGVKAEMNADNPFREFLGNEGKEEHTPAVGRAVFLATSGQMQSIDLDQHGLFAKIVLDGLKGAADKEGYEPDGVVTVDELTQYIDKELPELAHKQGKTKDEKGQQHFVLGGRASHFVLTRNPAVAARVKEQLDKLSKLAKDKKISPEFAEEGEKLLSQMPKLEAQRSLRKEYQELVAGKLDAEKFTEKRDAILDATKLKRTAALAYAKRVMEAVQVIREGYVKEVNAGDMVAWAVRGLYRLINEKMPAEVTDRLNKAKDLKDTELVRLLADIRERLGKREDLENNKDLDYSLQAMLKHLDPYTNYFNPETVERMRQDIQGTFTGIGVQIKKNFERDVLEVVTPLKGSPAYKAGIQEGDLIVKITREVDDHGKKLDKPEVVSTKGLPLNDAVKKIQGMPRTKVKITVEREGSDKPLEFEIQRSKVEMETVLGTRRKSTDEWDYMLDTASKIGYIRLTQFSRNSYRDMERAMKELEKEGIKGLVLDLRFDPGGLLDIAVKISDMFIDGGLIVTIKPRVGREHSFTGETRYPYTSFPMVVLVNGGSASASEILSACLQDHRRAIVVGERSYGKGSVQNIQPFEGGELKLTTASYWRPSGKNMNRTPGSKETDEWGVTPDKGYLVKMSPKEKEELLEHQKESEIIHRHDVEPKETKPAFQDKQLEAALEYLRGQIKIASRLTAKKAG